MEVGEAAEEQDTTVERHLHSKGAGTGAAAAVAAEGWKKRRSALRLQPAGKAARDEPQTHAASPHSAGEEASWRANQRGVQKWAVWVR